MKKILIALSVMLCVMLCAASAEEIDLKAMSYSELKALQSKLEKEIVSRPEWKEVEVPQGEWRVGQDIPAGEYSVSYNGTAKNGGLAFQVWRKAVDEFSDKGLVYNNVISYGAPIGKVVLEEGWIVIIKHSPAKFAPPLSLDF